MTNLKTVLNAYEERKAREAAHEEELRTQTLAQRRRLADYLERVVRPVFQEAEESLQKHNFPVTIGSIRRTNDENMLVSVELRFDPRRCGDLNQAAVFEVNAFDGKSMRLRKVTVWEDGPPQRPNRPVLRHESESRFQHDDCEGPQLAYIIAAFVEEVLSRQ